ncbi:MAG: hypothetical protein PWP23_3317 [Candidatus Sumerlaeota bacterium]|nr:hypothetical protein [Candidatus Sumerlaeota bacterium]
MERARRWTAWLPALAVAPFLFLFLFTTLQRIGVPYELEWNEGQSAEQALRFVQGLPLYPAPESGWVPYMYAPGYHIVFGTLFRVTGSRHLFWGRLISLMSTLAAALAIVLVVNDRTRHLPAAAMAGLLWFAWFRPSGFWFDIARNDALAFALAAWGCLFTLRLRPGRGEIAAGLLLLTLGTFTKQTVGPLAAFCALRLLVREGRRVPRRILVRVCLVGAALLSVSTVLLFERTGSTHLMHYVVHNAVHHPSDASVWMPGEVAPHVFALNTAGRSALGKAIEWTARSFADPPKVWTQAGRHVWLLVLAIPLLVLAGRRRFRGVAYLVPALLLGWGGLAGFAKYGGYRNNFLPLFLGVTILFGIGAGHALRKRTGLAGIVLPAALAVLLLVQTIQPWSLGKFDGGGLYYRPSAQLPAAGTDEAFADVMEWLDEKRRAGETVWVPHHQWYGYLAGHPIGMNPDMVRCAVWAGDPEPGELAGALKNGEYDWVLLDHEELADEWLSDPVRAALREYYEPLPQPIGRVPGAPDALLPATGAGMRPRWPWKKVDPVTVRAE